MGQKNYKIFLDDSLLNRIRFRFDIVKGKIVLVVIQYEAYIDNKWRAIVRYDCAHGFFHRDIIWPDGEKEKQEIVIVNLEDAANYAEQDITDRWQFYLERYLKRKRK